MVTVMFADLRGFTSFADTSTAREAIDHLNRFFAVAIPCVTREGGWAHKLLGDGLLGVFGAPGALPDHPDRALAAALGMLDTVQAPISIGLNTGLVLLGSLGAGELVELGVVGDPVNVAARVQDATRAHDTPLLVTEATRCLLEDASTLEPRGTIALRGKAKPITVHAPTAVTISGRSTHTLRSR